ncbi:MAG: alanine racemase [Planctomycetales bacterium]|nr:alanine racemase [Planctomycetales bacterium]
MAENFRAIAERVGPAVQICAVVKADAYGHGAVEVGRRLVREGAAALAVADSGESTALRKAGIRAPLLALGPVLPDEAPALARARASVAVADPSDLPPLEAAGEAVGRALAVHLLVDTGMARHGARPEEVAGLARQIASSGSLRLEGLWTHFAAASPSEPGPMLEQLAVFRRVAAEVEAAGVRVPLRHAAASAAIFVATAAHLDMVRPGLALYGADPGELRASGIPLRPALALRTRIAFLADLPAGSAVGYQPGYRTPRPTRLATLPVGYADGLPGSLGNRGRVLLRGRPAPIVGRISMDMTTVDVGGIPDAAAGDVVTLIGRDGDEEIRVEDLARDAGTIPWEILARIGPRVRRVYR